MTTLIREHMIMPMYEQVDDRSVGENGIVQVYYSLLMRLCKAMEAPELYAQIVKGTRIYASTVFSQLVFTLKTNKMAGSVGLRIIHSSVGHMFTMF